MNIVIKNILTLQFSKSTNCTVNWSAFSYLKKHHSL